MRKILFLPIIIFSAISIYAQRTEMGIRFGPNLNSLRGNDFIKEYHDPIIGYSAGLHVLINAHKQFSVSAALHYERNGSRINDIEFTDEFGNLTGRGDLYRYLDYLLMPLMARYSVGKDIKFFITGGPFLAYLLRNEDVMKLNENDPGGSGSGILISTNKDDYKSFNMGLSTGIGLHIPLNKKLGLETSFENHLGLYPIDDFEGPQNNRIKTNSLNFYLGLSYKL